MRNIKFLENRSELGAGTRGASLGIEALKMAAIANGSHLFHYTPHRVIPDMNNDLLLRPVKYPFAIKIDAMVEMYQRIGTAVRETLQEGSFPLVLSGDHSNAGGTVAGIRTAFPDKKLGLIWIDAHADLHSPYTTPSGNLHGMPLGVSLGLVQSDVMINRPDEVTCKSWEKLCSVGGIIPKVLPENLVFIGIRDLESVEWSIINDKNIKYYSPDDITEKGMTVIAREAQEYLASCDILYVSFDVDSLDPSVSKGTGTPVPGGLKAPQALELLTSLWRNPKLVSLEITEINPLLDSNNNMAKTVVTFIEKLVASPLNSEK